MHYKGVEEKAKEIVIGHPVAYAPNHLVAYSVHWGQLLVVNIYMATLPMAQLQLAAEQVSQEWTFVN